MVALVIAGTVTILFGLIIATDKVDRYWKWRNRPMQRTPIKPPPVFRTSLAQCEQCGRDDSPLSIDNGLCIFCFDLEANR